MTRLVIGLDSYGLLRESRRTTTPDPAVAATLADLAGADGISIGLRTDRRVAQERDVKVLRAIVGTQLIVRVPPTPESIKIVTPMRPDVVALVPERPDAIGHEAGFDLTVGAASLSESATALREAGLDVFALVDADREQVKAAHRMGLAGVSLLGARLGAARQPETAARELEAIDECARLAAKLGLSVHVAHGLDLEATRRLAKLPGIAAVEVGHAVVARAALVGLERAVRELKDALGGP